MTNGWKGIACTFLSLAALASLTGGVGAFDEKTPALATKIESFAQGVITPSEAPNENWPMTLRDALRIAIDNRDSVRVVTSGEKNPPVGGFASTSSGTNDKDRLSRSVRVVISKRDPDTPDWLFKTEIMSLCRTVEQRYWNLGQARVQQESTERAAKIAREIRDRETAELAVGRSTAADVAEASQRMEQLTLDLVTRASDTNTSEREFRNILSLPDADKRRIIPVTPPLEARFKPDWQTCLAEMIEHQPEIVLMKLAAGEPGPANSRSERLRENQRQTVALRTRILARFFNEIEATYNQLTSASRLRSAANQWLVAQRSQYEEGRVTIDRFLDAVSQACNAVATEAQYRTTYNVAIVALEEAKGTLLAYDNIALAEDSRQASTSGPKIVTAPPPPIHSIAPNMTQTESPGVQPAPTGNTSLRVWNFSFSIGRDDPFVIKGTIAEGRGDSRPD